MKINSSAINHFVFNHKLWVWVYCLCPAAAAAPDAPTAGPDPGLEFHYTTTSWLVFLGGNFCFNFCPAFCSCGHVEFWGRSSIEPFTPYSWFKVFPEVFCAAQRMHCCCIASIFIHLKVALVVAGRGSLMCF
uniref:Putative secreted protein n=1 Tax=Anopheles marajoara TaxID=58244 RepID=A0A2M4C6R2_9DIPT